LMSTDDPVLIISSLAVCCLLATLRKPAGRVLK
jgi:hypothetical protein